MAAAGAGAASGAGRLAVVRDFSVYSIVNVASLVLLLGTSLLLRKYLGPYLAGIWTGLEVLPIYATYAHLGVLSAAERELPYLLGAGRADRFERLRDTLAWFAHGLGIVMGLLLAVAAVAVRPTIADELFVGLLVYSAIVWAQLASTYYVVLYRARKRFVALSLRQGVANLLKAVAIVAGGLVFGLYGVYGGLLAGALVQVVLFRSGLDDPIYRRFERPLLPPLVMDGLPILLGALAFDTLRTADRIVLAATLGAEALGIYGVAALVCQGVFYVPNTLSIVMYPRFQERYGSTGDPQSLRRFVESPLRLLRDALVIATTTAYTVIAPIVLAWMPQFAAALGPLLLLLLATFFVGLAAVPMQFILTVRKQVHALLIGLAPTALALAGGWYAARVGLVAVASVMALAAFLQFAGTAAYAFRYFEAVPAVAHGIARYTAAGLYAALVMWLVDWADAQLAWPSVPTLVMRLSLTGVLIAPFVVRCGRELRATMRMQTL